MKGKALVSKLQIALVCLAAVNVVLSPVVEAMRIPVTTWYGRALHAVVALSPLDVAKARAVLTAGGLGLFGIALFGLSGACTPGERAAASRDVHVVAVDAEKAATDVEAACRIAVLANVPTTTAVLAAKACAILDPAAALTLLTAQAVLNAQGDGGVKSAVTPALNAVAAAQALGAAVAGKDGGS